MGHVWAGGCYDSEHPTVHLDHHATDEQLAILSTSDAESIRRTSCILAGGTEVGDTLELVARFPVTLTIDGSCDLLAGL